MYIGNFRSGQFEKFVVDAFVAARPVVRQIMTVQWNEELGAKSDAGRQLRFLP